MSKKVNPLMGRAAELDQCATNDLSVEENLAGGASVDDLISAGVLYDDYDPDNNPVYDFTPEPTAAEMAARRVEASKSPPMSDVEFKALLESSSKYARLAIEQRKEFNRHATWT